MAEDPTVTYNKPEGRVVYEARSPRSPQVSRDLGLQVARESFGGLSLAGVAAGTLVLDTVVMLLGVIVTGALIAVAVDSDIQLWQAVTAAAVVFFLGAFAGGWTAGRVARYDGVINGIAASLTFVLLTAITGGLIFWFVAANDLVVAVEGTDAFQTLTETEFGGIEGWIYGLGALVALVAGGALGGWLGESYHRKADRLIAQVAASAPDV
jgi:hypothetical protein